MAYGPYKRTMATDCRIYSEAQGFARKVRAAAAGWPCRAQPHEITLVEQTLEACVLEHVPAKIIGDKA